MRHFGSRCGADHGFNAGYCRNTARCVAVFGWPSKGQVSDCQGALCGRVVWLKEPLDPETRRPRTDKQNPDASKRDRPMLGLNVVRGLQPAGENKWSGAIYNADDGKSYDVNVKLVSSKKMALKGCVLGVLCKSQTWTRAE